MEGMMENRSSVAVLGVYLTVVAALVGSIGVALALVGGSVVSDQSPRVKSPFEIQLESAREIRQALAKPIPQPERLTPMTAKPAKVASARTAPKKHNAGVAMRQSRQAFANIDRPSQPQQSQPQGFFGFLAFGPGGRH
jgi:hypothetical protein